MNNPKKYKISAIGILISGVCIYLALWKIDVEGTLHAFKKPNYWFLLPAIMVLFFSHFLRTLRWRYLLDPIKRMDILTLFSPLMIGYAVNTFMPAHLGEFSRAYVLSKRGQLPLAQIAATIVIERVIDVFSLLVLMLLVFRIYRFPEWVAKSGYIMFAGSAGLLILLMFLKITTSATMKFMHFILKPLPKTFNREIESTLLKFLSGITPLKRWHDYITMSVLSVIMWLSYCAVFYFCLHAFNFMEMYGLNWSVSLVLLVITSIAIVVPSSPGYVGTYHYLCQISLIMFGVPADSALTFAVVVHGVTFIPVFVAGLFFVHREGMSLLKMSKHGFGSREDMPVTTGES